MRRVCLSGASYVTANIDFTWSVQRWLWSCEQSLRNADCLDAFLAQIEKDATQDPQWMLDYSVMEELCGKLICAKVPLNFKLQRLNIIHNTLCHVAECVDLKHVHMVLSSAHSVRSAVELVRRASLSRKVDSVEMHIHASALNECDSDRNEKAEHVVRDIGILQLFEELASFEVVESSLKRLSIVMIDDPRRSRGFWSEALIFSLSSLLHRLHLTHVSLNYIVLDDRSEFCLKQLVKALDNSSSTLRSLVLKAVPSLVKLVLKSRMLQRCKMLQYLDLSHNHLGDQWNAQLVEDLQEGIGGWKRLHRLSLAECDVSGYSLELLSRGFPKQKKKEEGGKVEDATSSLACVEEINLGSNKLIDNSVFYLSTCLMLCHSLKQLDLRHNCIPTSGMKQIFSSLIHASSLRCLRLRSNRLTDEGMHSFVVYAKQWQELEELDVSRCRLTIDSLGELATVLGSLPNLRVLRLAGNDLRPVKLSNTNFLLNQKLDNTGTGDEGATKLFAYDPSYMHYRNDSPSGTTFDHNIKVPTSFELDRRDRESGRVRYLGTEPIKQEVTARPSRDVEVDPFQVFGAALGVDQQLRVLDLSDCSLQDEGFVSIASNLMLSQLEELHLSANPLFIKGEASLQALTRLLRSATATLRILDLSFVGLGDRGVSALCDGLLIEDKDSETGVLRELKHLEVLYLSHTGARSLAFEAIHDTVGDLRQLRALFVNGNRCLGQDLINLLRSLCCHRQLRFVAISGCLASQKEHNEVISSKAFKELCNMGVKVVI